MRCLHCNKKLSLLKMAKGDSFCSAEHFDAYQLQLSRSAYDRLVNVPEEEASKPLLVLKKEEIAEQTGDLDAETVLARLSVFQAPDIQTPPYAPFLASPPPFCQPDPAVLPASEPDGNEPVVAARDLAFPVHDVQSTACILNLHRQQGLSETSPRDWAPESEIIATPEDFSGEIARPTLAGGENVELLENPAPGEMDELAQACLDGPAAPAAGADVEPFEKDESAKIASPVISSNNPAVEQQFVEYDMPMLAADQDIEPLETAAPGETDELAQEPVEITQSIEAVFLNQAVLELEAVEHERSMPALNKAQEPVAAAPTKAARERRLPFLVAPSFGERDWDAVPFDATASSAPRDWILAPTLDTAQEPGAAWSGAIARPTGFAGIPPLRTKDSAFDRIQSGVAMTTVAAPLLPGETAIESYGWHTSSGSLGIGRPALEISRVSTSALDFAMPSPAPVRPVATLTPVHLTPAVVGTDSLVRSVLETGSKGQVPAAVASSEDAMECGLPAILAAFPAWVGSSPALLRQAPHFSTRPPLADSAGPVEFAAEPVRYMPDCGKEIQPDAGGERAPSVAMLPCQATEWRRADFALPAVADPTTTGWQPAVCLLTPTAVWERPELAANTAWRTVFERTFITAASGVFGHLESTVLAATSLPSDVDIPVRDWRIGLCPPTINWNPGSPAMPNRPLAFLPARGGAILPSAKAWPRLGALAQ